MLRQLERGLDILLSGDAERLARPPGQLRGQVPLLRLPEDIQWLQAVAVGRRQVRHLEPRRRLRHDENKQR